MVGTPTYKRMNPGRYRPNGPTYGPGWSPRTQTRKPMRTAPLRPRLAPATVIPRRRAATAAMRLLPLLRGLAGPVGLGLTLAPLLLEYAMKPGGPPMEGMPEDGWWFEDGVWWHEGLSLRDSTPDGNFSRSSWSRLGKGQGWIDFSGYPHEQEAYFDNPTNWTGNYWRYYPSFIVPPDTPMPPPGEWLPEPQLPQLPFGPAPMPQPVPSPGRSPDDPKYDPQDDQTPHRRRRKRYVYRPSATPTENPIVAINLKPDGSVIFEKGPSVRTRPKRTQKETKVRNPITRILSAALDHGSEITEFIEMWGELVGIEPDVDMPQRMHEMFIQGKAWQVDPLDLAWEAIKNHYTDKLWGEVFQAQTDALKDLGQSTYTSPMW